MLVGPSFERNELVGQGDGPVARIVGELPRWCRAGRLQAERPDWAPDLDGGDLWLPVRVRVPVFDCFLEGRHPGIDEAEPRRETDLAQSEGQRRPLVYPSIWR